MECRYLGLAQPNVLTITQTGVKVDVLQEAPFMKPKRFSWQCPDSCDNILTLMYVHICISEFIPSQKEESGTSCIWGSSLRASLLSRMPQAPVPQHPRVWPHPTWVEKDVRGQCLSQGLRQWKWEQSGVSPWVQLVDTMCLHLTHTRRLPIMFPSAFSPLLSTGWLLHVLNSKSSCGVFL